MTAVRMLLASLGVAAVATGAVSASSGTNYSDQWGVPSEPNWGVSVQQQSDVLVIGLMLYGNDGRAMWFVASALPQDGQSPGRDVFAGELYTATGPYLAGTFDPKSVAARKVGTVTFDAADASHATISYTVDGATTVKEVVRQTWAYENLTGYYDAVWKLDCNGSYVVPYDWWFTDTIVTHEPDNTVTLRVALWASWYEIEHSLRGTYTQSGHLGEIRTDLVVPDSGSLTIAGIENTSNGFSGSVTGTLSDSCHVTNGRLVAVRRP